jgi:hypothetical protein
LAGQKRGFLGVRACRAGHVARRAFSLDASLIEFVTLMIAANNKIRTVFYICIYKIIIKLFGEWVCYACTEPLRHPLVGFVDYSRSLPTDRRQFNFIIFYFCISFLLLCFCPAQRGCKRNAPHLPSHSLDRWVPKRETFTLTPFVRTPKNVQF